MKNIILISTTVLSLLINYTGYSQNEIDPNNTLEEATTFKVIEENERHTISVTFTHKKRGLVQNFYPMVTSELVI